MFLVTTFTSAASAVAARVVQNPSSAVTLLAKSLPKASNFYINWLVLYGLAVGGKTIANIVALAIWFFLAKFLDNTPRKIYNRYVNVDGLKWGSVYPVYANLGVIAFSYAIIAPLILGFAVVGLSLLYIAFRYNVFYTLDNNNINTQGRAYAHALTHLTTGVFIGQICLIGLIAINTADTKSAIGPLVLAIIGLVGTVVFFIILRRTTKPLMNALPEDVMMQRMKSSDRHTEDGHVTDNSDTQYGGHDGDHSTKFMKPVTHKTGRKSYLERLLNPSALPPLAPHMSQPVPEYSSDTRREAYFGTSVTTPSPIVWIVHDEMGISAREKAANGRVISTSDYGAWWESNSGNLTTCWQNEGDEKKVQDVPLYQKPIEY